MKRKRTTINLGRYRVDDELSVRFTPSVLDRIFEAIAIVQGLVTSGLALYWCCKHPATDIFFWLIPFLTLIAVFILYRQGYASPQKISFPFRITKQNLGIQYLLAVRLIRVLNIFISAMILCAVLALYISNPNFPLVNIAFVILMFICLISYYVLAYLHR